MARTWSGGPDAEQPELEPINWRRFGVIGVCLLAAVVLLMVGGPAAVASYRHARWVVEQYGDPVMAPWLPLTTDGMLLAALVVMWVRRVLGHDIGRGPWLAFALGLFATLYANIIAAQDGVAGFLVAVWPPVCLAVTLELLALLVVYAQRGPDRPGDRSEDLTDHHEDHPAGAAEATDDPAWLEAAVPGDAVWTVPTDRGPDRIDVDAWAALPDEHYVEPDRTDDRTDERRTGSDDDIRAWIRTARAEAGAMPTRYAVMRAWKGGTGRIDRLLREVDGELEQVRS
jgi:hypothetical protein